MKKNHIILTTLAAFSLALVSFIPKEAPVVTITNDSAVVKAPAASTASTLSTTLYEGLKLEEAGLSKEAMDRAIKGYEKLVNNGQVQNSQYLTIIDFSQSSRKKRFYLIDVKNQELLINTFVSHGKNTGVDMAERFSNRINSEQSSLGFYVTTVTYTGKHGTSLRLSGKEAGFNDNAEARGIVVHGADYVNAGRVNSGYMGRSQGCPALPQNEYAKIINIIKNGSVMFIYHPSEEYIQKSQLING